MQLHRLNSLLLISLIILAMFGCTSSFFTSLSLSKDLLILSDATDYRWYLLMLNDSMTKLKGIQFINLSVLITLPLIALLFLLISNSELFIFENKRVVFQDAKEVLKQHPHIVWTELLNPTSAS